MLVKHYACSMLNVEYVELPDGEELTTADAAANARVYGTYVLSGSYKVTASDDPQFVGRTFAPGGFNLNDITCGATVKAHGDTVWFCTSQNDDVRRNVSMLAVDGTATLPANHGFFVLEGSVQADGKVADQFRFFRPRPNALEVQGNGVLLLVE